MQAILLHKADSAKSTPGWSKSACSSLVSPRCSRVCRPENPGDDVLTSSLSQDTSTLPRNVRAGAPGNGFGRGSFFGISTFPAVISHFVWASGIRAEPGVPDAHGGAEVPDGKKRCEAERCFEPLFDQMTWTASDFCRPHNTEANCNTASNYF